MSRMPRLLPLVAVAIGGVLAVKGLTEAPQIWLGAQALAEDVVHTGGPKPAVPPDASILSGTPAVGTVGAAAKGPPACAPTAAELAREAGLSPAELQVLQSLGDRRGQLDQREATLDTQVQLIAAAEAKLDSRIGQMNQLKADIQGLIGQADQQAQADQDRLVRVYEDMPPKAAAAALTVMDDSVRLPIAAKMKERKLADVLRYMAPADAKTLTEKLAQRTSGAQILADAKNVVNPQAQAAAQAPKNPPAQAQTGQPAQADQGDTADKTDKTAKTGKTGKTAKTTKRPPKTPPADATAAQAQPPAQPKTPKSPQTQATGQPPAPAKAG